MRDWVAIELSNGLPAYLDIADLALLSRASSWHAHVKRHTYYVRGSMTAQRPKLQLHRLMLPTAQLVDHINGLGFDCRRHNLRAATHTLNRANLHRWRPNPQFIRPYFDRAFTRHWHWFDHQAEAYATESHFITALLRHDRSAWLAGRPELISLPRALISAWLDPFPWQTLLNLPASAEDPLENHLRNEEQT